MNKTNLNAKQMEHTRSHKQTNKQKMIFYLSN